VPTPEIVAYVVYEAGPLLRRSDVATREVPGGSDLAAVLTGGAAADRRGALEATSSLIARLSACGARHHDLNVKNVLLAPRESAAPTAYVLDVDRVEFGRPGDSRVTEGNLERFMRSARKWRALHDARVDEAELVRVAASVRRLVAARSPNGAPESTRS
jgi:3-deoxy-D-manno-octulosonic acid kinase